MDDNTSIVDSFPSILHKDSFLVFRALCRLSKKSLVEEGSTAASDPLAVRNKILSLELIYHILESAGTLLMSHDKQMGLS
jgi:brefeldin A-inhibited guanine nucleotide-exchange protein